MQNVTANLTLIRFTLTQWKVETLVVVNLDSDVARRSLLYENFVIFFLENDLKLVLVFHGKLRRTEPADHHIT